MMEELFLHPQTEFPQSHPLDVLEKCMHGFVQRGNHFFPNYFSGLEEQHVPAE
jgi:hypothetical protein